MIDCGEFGKAFIEIYPTNPELKVEHNCIHATFLDLVVSLDKDKFIFKMFDKRDTFNFQIVRNVIFYRSTMSDFARIAKSILYLKDFLPAAKNLLDWMISQAGSNQLPLKQNKKVFNRHPESF